jgi:hypothetical protein
LVLEDERKRKQGNEGEGEGDSVKADDEMTRFDVDG